MRRLATLGMACVAAATLAAMPATRPMTGPSTAESVRGALGRLLTSRPATTQAITTQAATTQALATVDPAAGPLLVRLHQAALFPGPLHVVGDIVGVFDVAGRRKTYTLHVDGRTDGDGRFLHDVGPAGLIVNDGKSAWLYDRRRDAFASLTPFQGRRPAEDIEQALIDVLLDENPALLLSLTTDPTALLRRSATAIRPATRPSAVVLERTAKHVTLHLRPEDGSIRSSEIDFTPLMTSRRAQGVAAARATLTYQTPTRDVPPADLFTWQPPPTATEFRLSAELARSDPSTRPTTP